MKLAPCLVALLTLSGSAQAANAPPSFAVVQAAHRPSDGVLRDRAGEPLEIGRAHV